MTVTQETLNTILSAAGLAVSVLALLIAVMGALAGVVVAAFISGLLIGVLITHSVHDQRKP
jgi:small-conductance mechanosensitive channel